MRCSNLLRVLAFGCIAVVGSGREANARPDPAMAAADPVINRPYENPDVEYWRGVFESGQREIYRHREDILRALDLHAGMRVADIGAGTGFFSLMFARVVGAEGTVYAVDISPAFVTAIRERASTEGLGNVIGVVNTPRDTLLPPEGIDLVFISDTYHHFEYPRETLDSIHRALVPGGEVVVVDFRRIAGQSSPWVLGHVRAGAPVVIRELEQAGFRYGGSLDFMSTQYFLRFRKPGPGSASPGPVTPLQ